MTRVPLDRAFALNVEVGCASSGPPLVLLHGFTGSAASWGPLAPLSASFTTIAIDLVGHGQSDSPAGLDHYTMPQCVDDIVAALQALGHSSAHWLGYSMGARTALHVAAAYPQAVRSLVLIGGSPGLDCVEDRIARRTADEALAARIDRDGVPAFIDYWENIPLFATQRSLPEERRAATRAGRLRNSALGIANSLRGMGTGAQEPLHERLPELTMPTLLLAGELDTKFLDAGREMAARLPSAQLVPVAGAGHAAHTENPDFCLEAIRAFLARIALEGTRP